MDGVKANTTVKMGSDRAFGVVFFIFFVVIGLLPLFNNNQPRIWSLVTGAVFLLVALFVPKLLRPLNRVWFYVGIGLHHVVNPIIMGILFFVTVTPMGLVMRMARNDPLRLKKDESAKSYWIKKDMESNKETLKRQF